MEGCVKYRSQASLRHQLHKLESELCALTDNWAALTSCLQAGGLLTTQALEAHRHRLRFTKLLQAKPLDSSPLDASLSSLISEQPKVALRIGLLCDVQGVSSLACSSQQVRQSLKPLVRRLKDASGRLFVIGGSHAGHCLRSAETLDPLSGRWERLPDMHGARQGCATVAVSAHWLYVCGGSDGSRSLSSAEAFNALEHTWHSLPPMANKRSFPVAGVLGSLVYVTGGDDGKVALLSTEVYDPAAGWSLGVPMRQERYGAAAAVADGALYVAGGRSSLESGTCLASMERFFPQASAWEEMPSMRVARFRGACARLGGLLYMFGGTCASGSLQSVDAFLLSEAVWQPAGTMLQPAFGFGVAKVGAAMFLCGGYCKDHFCSRCDSFDGAQRWLVVSPMLQPRLDPGVAASATTWAWRGALPIGEGCLRPPSRGLDDEEEEEEVQLPSGGSHARL